MKKILSFQLRNSFRSLGFLFSFTVFMIMCIINMMMLAWRCRGISSSNAVTAAEAFILRTDVPMNDLLRTLYVFLIVFPAGFMAYKNNKLNITPVFRSRVPAYKYAVAEALNGFLSGFLCFFIPLAVSIALNSIVFSNRETALFSYNYAASLTGDNVFQNTISKGVPFLSLFINHPQVYNLLYALIFSFFCGILSMFICAAANLIKSLPIFLFLPVYLIHYVMQRADSIISSKGTEYLYINYDMTDYIMIRTFYGKSLLYFVILCMALIIISAVLYGLNYKYETNGGLWLDLKAALRR